MARISYSNASAETLVARLLKPEETFKKLTKSTPTELEISEYMKKNFFQAKIKLGEAGLRQKIGDPLYNKLCPNGDCGKTYSRSKPTRKGRASHSRYR